VGHGRYRPFPHWTQNTGSLDQTSSAVTVDICDLADALGLVAQIKYPGWSFLLFVGA
jgi:hypothetical protein